MSTEYRIEQFDPSKAGPSRVWLLIGARNSGKSVLLHDLLYNNQKNIDFATAMTATVSTVNKFAEIMPRSLIHTNGYDYEKGEAFLKTTQKLVKKNKIRNAAIILDDCMFDNKVMKTETQRNLHLNGRHYNTSIFNTTQYCMIIPNCIRTNVDYIFALKDTIKANRRRLYEYFFGSFPSFNEFEKVFTKCTENFGCLVLDNTQSSGKQEDLVKWYVANPNIPKFRLGKPIYYRFETIIKNMQKGKKNNAQNTKVIV
jgi:hypothetical protein